MYQKLIGFKSENIKQQDIFSYLQNYSRSVFSKLGSSNAFGKWLSVGEMDGLRIWLGVPECWMTQNRQHYAEVIYAYTFDLSFNSHPEIWTDTPKIQFKNPNYYFGKYNEIILDVEFIENFGIRLAAWEKEVFYTTGLFNRIKQGSCSEEQNFRCYIALAMFGFSEPEQFFTKNAFNTSFLNGV